MGRTLFDPKISAMSGVRGDTVRAVPAKTVIEMLMHKGRGADVIKLITAYEASVYGNPHLKSTNGYEARRRSLPWP